MKCWQFSTPDKTAAAQLSDDYGIPPFLALLLVTRGMQSPAEIERYRAYDSWYDPMLLPDMDRAVARIQQALEQFEPILIYGDYDADGITATAMLYSYFNDCGANVRFALPSRESGYGLNKEVIDRAVTEGIRLIITVDNGVSAVEEIAYATQMGIDTVVTDHHKPPEVLPPAVAVVDPHCAGNRSPFVPLCGAGVVFKLIAALEDSGDRLPEELLDQFSDLAAIGTVGDIVPLQGENRTLVRAGLQKLMRGERIGLQKLLSMASVKEGTAVTAGQLSFGLIPRINAMGRMHTSEQVVQLCLTEDEAEAEEISGRLEQANYERQQEETSVAEAAEELLRKEPRRLLDRILVLWRDEWHPGVLGIAASRITEKYGKPTLLISVHDGVATGSCRSLNGFSIIEALTSCADLFSRYGGHTMAAGFALPAERLPELTHRINQFAAQQNSMPMPTLQIDCKLNPMGLSPDIVDQLQEMEPFGAGNPTPIFALMGMQLEHIQPVGGGRHLKLTLSRNERQLTAMLFRTTPEQFPYRAGDRLDLAVTLDKSTYRGTTELSVFIRDYRPENYDVTSLLLQKQQYEAFARGEKTELRALLPDRNQVAAVYRLLKAEGEAPRKHGLFVLSFTYCQCGI